MHTHTQTTKHPFTTALAADSAVSSASCSTSAYCLCLSFEDAERVIAEDWKRDCDRTDATGLVSRAEAAAATTALNSTTSTTRGGGGGGGTAVMIRSKHSMAGAGAGAAVAAAAAAAAAARTPQPLVSLIHFKPKRRRSASKAIQALPKKPLPNLDGRMVTGLPLAKDVVMEAPKKVCVCVSVCVQVCL